MTAPETLEGWYALHDMRILDRVAWRNLAPPEREKAAAETADLLASFERVDDASEGLTVTYAVAGHKADLMMIHFRPRIDDLLALEQAFDQTQLAPMTTRPTSYVSVIEVSRHGAPEGSAHNIENSPYIQARIRPALPDHSRYVCFYPMNKRRLLDDNWYSLPQEERTDLMRAHGRTGRRYAGKVTQVVTGSIGFDDWEWGVTLFSDDPLQFKKLIYEMRFDEVSARYAEFGPFYVGKRVESHDLGRWLGD